MIKNIFLLFKKLNKLVIGYSKEEYQILADSALFDESYTKLSAEFPQNSTREEMLKIYLKNKTLWPMKTSQEFDGTHYLGKYEDVYQAGINPLLHYLKYGVKEGRLPRKNVALAYEHHLWSGNHSIMIPKLKTLIKLRTSELEYCYACWALSRWYYYLGDFSESLIYCELANNARSHFSNNGLNVLFCQLLIRCNQKSDAQKEIVSFKSAQSNAADFCLLEFNLLNSSASFDHCQNRKKVDVLNQVFKKHGLEKIRYTDNCNNIYSMDDLYSSGELINHGIKVSIIVPTYNASPYIERTLSCILNQTWKNIEVLIVDDCSDDDTLLKVNRWLELNKSAANEKFRVIKQIKNKGAYHARNRGVRESSGDFITVHDSDDWSHCQKIEKQALALVNCEAKASVSHWVRCTQSLFFDYWRPDNSLVHRNVSSLMIKREVLSKLGVWDSVKFGADTEYYYRILKAYGGKSIVEVLSGIPLSFGLINKNSLTNLEASHLISQFQGNRKDYLDSAKQWHNENSTPYLSEFSERRPFPIPYEMSLGLTQKTSEYLCDADLIRYSGMWDPIWYVRKYAFLQEELADPLEHYINEGFRNLFDPSPKFSVSWFVNIHLTRGDKESDISISEVFSPLANQQLIESFPTFEGRALKSNNPTILLCGHASGMTLFGAEKSLLDIAKAIAKLNYNLVISLPSAENLHYIECLKEYCQAFVIINDPWWQSGANIFKHTEKLFLTAIEKYQVDLIYLNTLVHNSIYSACRNLKIPIITHVRELLSADDSLLKTLGASAKEAYDRVSTNSNHLIANSNQMKAELLTVLTNPDAKRISVIPNCFSFEYKNEKNDLAAGPNNNVLFFGLVSSNLPKKGVVDFVNLAGLFEKADILNARFKLFGPTTPLTKKIAREKEKGLHTLVDIEPYIDDPEQLYDKIDVIVNLSHFQESFGRTILEGMAFGLPTLCYSHGALVNLVEHNKSGFLVPFRSESDLFVMAKKLALDSALRSSMGERAVQIANSSFSHERFVERVSVVLEELLP
ncbi:glycosyltransferase [Aliiglaciecola sp. M165]|uniref:glycosyltransferase n=1 Tax=Aliiglaciecola sp. M165 TaxID=2593649 RepID=UPI00117EFFAA|nr:glycosyltransferase [Aliiglaciecola sp. M165]TRY30777.1 glycosyltransferase [Aliiglaciecola sp. M165]